jgi:hypothetical protein
MEKELEKKIRGCFISIKNGKSPKDTNIGKYINKLKGINEPLYLSLLDEYKKILAK